MKKIMISCGLRGKENAPAFRDLCEKTTREHYDDEIEILHSHGTPEVKFIYTGNRVEGLGHNIMTELAHCDEVVFIDDFHNYDGCRCEHFIATQYHIPIVYLNTTSITKELINNASNL